MGDETFEIIGVIGEMPDRRTDGRPCCVDSGHDQQKDRTKDVFVGKLFAHDLGVEKITDESVIGVFAPFDNCWDDVILDRLERFNSFFGGEVDAFEDDANKFAELLTIFSRKSAELRNEANRDVLGVLDTRVDEVGIAHFVEQLVAEFSCERFECCNWSRGESGKQQSPSDFVERWVRGDGRRNADWCRQGVVTWSTVINDDGARSEMFRVVCDRRNGVVGHRSPEAAVTVTVGDRTTFAKVVHDRVGIGNPCFVSVIEVCCEIFYRRVDHVQSPIVIANSGQLPAASFAFASCSSLSSPVTTTTAVPRSSQSKRSGARL